MDNLVCRPVIAFLAHPFKDQDVRVRVNSLSIVKGVSLVELSRISVSPVFLSTCSSEWGKNRALMLMTSEKARM